MGVDPYLQQVPFTKSVRCLTGFAARTRTGYYGKGQQVQSSTVTSAIMAIGQTISLACNNNPTKIAGSDKFIPAIQVMIDGYTKADPPTKKMLPVKADVPKLLVKMGSLASCTLSLVLKPGIFAIDVGRTPSSLDF
jgi:hypothetical protein